MMQGRFYVPTSISPNFVDLSGRCHLVPSILVVFAVLVQKLIFLGGFLINGEGSWAWCRVEIAETVASAKPNRMRLATTHR
jgi:hypothetical protein